MALKLSLSRLLANEEEPLLTDDVLTAAYIIRDQVRGGLLFRHAMLTLLGATLVEKARRPLFGSSGEGRTAQEEAR